VSQRLHCSKLFAAILLSVCVWHLTCPAWAIDDFSSGWEPKPLVDTSAPANKPAVAPTQPQASKPTGPSSEEIEKRLKPAEPFIQDVETRLSIKPKSGDLLAQRLSRLQMVLFGEPKYDDAGQLLAKLSEMFPQEAAKAEAALLTQAKTVVPPISAAGSKSKQAVVHAPASSVTSAPQPMMSPQVSSTQPQKKRNLWKSDDDWDGFDNDIFFNEPTSRNDSGSGAGSTLRALGQGLGGLAMMAGSLAGTYYLNKKMGNGPSPYYPNNGYYNNGYYNNGGYYNTPYGYAPYGAYPTGILPPGTYSLPPGYNGTYGPPTGYYAPYNYNNAGLRPYGRFGNGTSALGVPTGLLPY
jgi:hypothetical protein